MRSCLLPCDLELAASLSFCRSLNRKLLSRGEPAWRHLSSRLVHYLRMPLTMFPHFTHLDLC